MPGLRARPAAARFKARVREKTPERVKTPAPEAAQAANHFGKTLSSTFSVCCDFDAWATNGDACSIAGHGLHCTQWSDCDRAEKWAFLFRKAPETGTPIFFWSPLQNTAKLRR